MALPALHGRSTVVARTVAEQFDRATPKTLDGNVLNVRPSPIDFRDRFYEPGLVRVSSAMLPPARVLEQFLYRDQGAEGNCTGQALAAVIDLQNLERFVEMADVPH